MTAAAKGTPPDGGSPAGDGPRPVTYDRLKALKKAPTLTVSLCLDSEVADALAEAEQGVQAALAKVSAQNSAPNRRALEDARAALDSARDAAREVTVDFRFQALGRARYEKLLLAHPPTPKQKKEAEDEGRGEPEWDSDAFPQALVAATLIDPELSETEVKSIFDDDDTTWTTSELLMLFNTAMAVNGTTRVVDLGKESGPTGASVRS